jgi:2-polyprenyl-3-methyl-5-hydroxy-6-metoxy-1,4-benzoquinol methylase
MVRRGLIFSGGTTIQNKFQKLVYDLFGTSLYISPPIRGQINWISARIPPSFLNREVDDLGCGDGRISRVMGQIFKAKKVRGFDVYPSLVKRARRNGVDACVMDLEAGMPSGELAVMWGVLHHLKDRETCIKRISENYPMVFIREPIKTISVKVFEMGDPIEKEEIEELVNKYLPGAQVLYYSFCVYVFYNRNRAK